MKQIVQRINPKYGVKLMDVPAPKNKDGNVLIRTTRSLVSKGTESTIVQFGKASMLEKIKQRPEKIKQLINNLKSQGFIKTIDNANDSLNQLISLGYCNCGVVIESNVVGINVGDRVVSNGPHAEIVRVPANLVAKIPDNVSDDTAVFTVISSIGLQGMRLLNPTYGENIAVFGLGLVGLITIQLLQANGANVYGVDLDESKCNIAEKLGVKTFNPKDDNIYAKIKSMTDDVGVDGVIITAASDSNDIISESAKLCRKNGRIILVGVVGLDINRDDFYDKELTFQVSCSYGPGRYDSKYEEDGIDYPLPYVRWTEKRNFEAILRTMGMGKLKTELLVTEKIELKNYSEIYDNIDNRESIASIIEYPAKNKIIDNDSVLELHNKKFSKSTPIIGIIGSGNFTKSVIVPTLVDLDGKIKCIGSTNGLTSSYLANKYKMSYCTTDTEEIINDIDVDTIIVTTRHDTHAKYALKALEAGKNLFVEKPLALNYDELENIFNKYQKSNSASITVGYNRRFSSHARLIKKNINHDNLPINITITMNAGYVPSENWVNQKNIGGGRIIGEACHMIDLCIFFTNSEVKEVCMNSMDTDKENGVNDGSLLLKFRNGSNATINYFTNGSDTYSKERVEVYDNNNVFIIDNFNITKAYGTNRFKNFKKLNDKGHKRQFSEYLNALKNGLRGVIPANQLYNCSKTAIAATESLIKNKWIKV